MRQNRAPCASSSGLHIQPSSARPGAENDEQYQDKLSTAYCAPSSPSLQNHIRRRHSFSSIKVGRKGPLNILLSSSQPEATFVFSLHPSMSTNHNPCGRQSMAWPERGERERQLIACRDAHLVGRTGFPGVVLPCLRPFRPCMRTYATARSKTPW
jgi:hypothetical protein